jgi:hypothetical protein
MIEILHHTKIQRALLVTVGPQAEAVAQRTLDLSRTWLCTAPPLESVAFDASSTEERLLEIWSQLAGAERIDAMAEQGFALERTDEILIWLLLDVATWQKTTEGEGVSSPSMDTLLAFVDQLESTAWAQLRVRTLTHALLLAAPQHQAQAQEIVRHLSSPCAGRIYLSGPVDYRRLRLDDARWHERTAAAIAAHIWGRQPGHTVLHQRPANAASVYALGAVAWVPPRRAVAEWLCTTWAVHTLAAFTRSDGEIPAEEALVSMLPASPARMLEELQAGLSRPAFVRFAANERPPLTSLPHTAERIQTRLHRLEERAGPERRQRRQAWLEQGLKEWMQTLDRLRTDLLTGDQHMAQSHAQPRLHLYRLHLKALAHKLSGRLRQIDEMLCDLADQLAQAQEICRREEAALNKLCATIPCPTPLGLLQMGGQPWRWPGWLRRYLQLIPWQMQIYLESLHRHVLVAWEETNWHTVRQAHLVMLQTTQERLLDLDRLEDVLTSSAAHLAQHLEDAVTELSLPWTEERLNWLYDHLLGDGTIAARDFTAAQPLPSWTDSEPGVLANALAGWIRPRLGNLEAWSSVDFLVAALPEQRFEQWLDRFIDEARPLWPPQELVAARPVETWFYEPKTDSTPVLSTEDSLDLPIVESQPTLNLQSWTRLAAWREGQEDLHTIHSPIDGIVALRWLPVDLSME